MKDFRGIEIVEGDLVAYVSGGRYTTRHTARVVGFTPKMMKIVPLEYWDKYPERPSYYTSTVYPDVCWVLDRKA